jgi:ADP-ribose pyrophosphatase
MVLAVTAADEVVLVEQYRAPLDVRVVELPAGLVGDASAGDDDSEEAAVRREMAEETGYRVGRVWRLGSGPASPGSSAEVVPIYRADGLVRLHDGGGVDGEAIEVHRVPRREVTAWLAARERLGRLVDARIYAALYLDAVTAPPA